jgi:hypothetical protein
MICKGDILGVVNDTGITSQWKVLSFDGEKGTVQVECTMSSYKTNLSVGEIQEGLLSAVIEGMEGGRVIYMENALTRLKRRHKK